MRKQNSDQKNQIIKNVNVFINTEKLKYTAERDRKMKQ